MLRTRAVTLVEGLVIAAIVAIILAIAYPIIRSDEAEGKKLARDMVAIGQAKIVIIDKLTVIDGYRWQMALVEPDETKTLRIICLPPKVELFVGDIVNVVPDKVEPYYKIIRVR